MVSSDSTCLPTISSRVRPRRSRSVAFMSCTLPSSPNEMNPQGALSSIASSAGLSPPVPPVGSGSYRRSQIILDERHSFLGIAHVRAVTSRFHEPERASWQFPMQVFPNLRWRDHIVGALKYQRWNRDALEIVAVVGQKRSLGKTTGNHRISRAEARGQLFSELRPIGIFHYRRGEEIGPADEVPVHHLEEALYILPLEPADIWSVVDIAGRWANEYETLESIRLPVGGENAHHAADRVSYKDHIVQIERVNQIEHILRVALETSVPRGVVRTEIGSTRSDIVEQHKLVITLEIRRDEPPHVLITPESMSEQHRLRSAAENGNVVATQDILIHFTLRGGRSCNARHE